MNRFNEKAYRSLIRPRCLTEDCYCLDKDSRFTIRHKRKEQRLWKKRILEDRLVAVVTISLALLFIIDFCFIYFHLWEGWWSFVVFIAPLCVMGLILVFYPILAIVRRKKALANRTAADMDEFITGSVTLQNIDPNFLKIVRETLGYVYKVPFSTIYSSDTSTSLAPLRGRNGDPFGFEVVLGVAESLGISLSESEVDRIVNRIFEESSNVEDLVCILSEEIRIDPSY